MPCGQIDGYILSLGIDKCRHAWQRARANNNLSAAFFRGRRQMRTSDNDADRIAIRVCGHGQDTTSRRDGHGGVMPGHAVCGPGASRRLDPHRTIVHACSSHRHSCSGVRPSPSVSTWGGPSGQAAGLPNPRTRGRRILPPSGGTGPEQSGPRRQAGPITCPTARHAARPRPRTPAIRGEKICRDIDLKWQEILFPPFFSRSFPDHGELRSGHDGAGRVRTVRLDGSSRCDRPPAIAYFQ